MRSACIFAIVSSTVIAAPVEFNRDIRPILSDKCFFCHGPDPTNRRSKVRFDQEAGAKQDLGGRFAIVPGDSAKSVMYQRITSGTKGLRMPPVQTGLTLTDREIGLIKQWIDEGAQWQKHWSFLPPKQSELPAVGKKDWPRNPIDYFVLARLEREGLPPTPEASKATQLRRVSLDLTGLPPTPAELEAFLKNDSPKAYEAEVDRLLASPRYGERMAARWLDAARYADTNGYQTDAERFMWRWRDWVIDAFNSNMRFDRFTVEQLAGDLLPNPTRDQVIATGFNRNHRGNGEGGSIAAEFAVEYVVDRVETTSTVWLGLTMGCTRCHNHKYDPFTQKDFYSLYAFFNNIPEKGKVFKYGNSPPLVPAPTREQERRLAEIEAKLKAAAEAFDATTAERARAQRDWETAGPSADWTLKTNLLFQAPGGPFDGKSAKDAGNVAPYGFYNRFSLAAWVKPGSPNGAVITRAKDIEEEAGYGLYLRDGKLQGNFVVRWLDDCLRVETEEPIAMNEWTHVAMTYDGSRVADGVKIYVNGKSAKLRYVVDDLNQNFQVKEPLRIGGGNGLRFHGEIEDVRVYNDVLTARQAAVVALKTPVAEIAKVPANKRTQAQADKLEWAFLDEFGPDGIRKAWKELNEARRMRELFLDNVPTVMVMQELPYVRDTHVLVRGAYDRPGDKVTRAVPASLPPLPQGAPVNRLGLAQWIVSPDNPLTARVTVNRFWQMLFGTGIVKTVEDFGSQGEWPVHPELLDWLATEFVKSGWDVKHIMKTIVMSATYRQSSRATPELVQKDPDNRLLARGPRFRMAPEMIRDQALAASGLLVEHLGGPSVKPYQPVGLWKELSGSTDYQRDTGDKLYRRSMYTFWKRAVPPPGLMTFDSAGRETCVVRENRTNTPLQALTLMNDETYLEAARKMAERMIREGGTTPVERVRYGFTLAMSRAPSEREQQVLTASYHRNLDRYKTDPSLADKFLTAGESERDKQIDATEVAAYATVASVILNLDETVTKE
ncbi:MAG: DUF1553 domain-containing protein [Bryobacterales bacterium]|nr:DUF1553 domain-containing protein [Bryobacterales bacterium]